MMLKFIKKYFFTAMTFFSISEIAFSGITFNPLSVNSLECVSMNHQKYRIRSEIMDVNTHEPVFYP